MSPNPLKNALSYKANNSLLNDNTKQQLKQMYNQLQSGKLNPTSMIIQMAQGNPRFKPIISMLQNGMSYENVAKYMFDNMGININDFINDIFK